jgi:uncharacterized protein YutE (UPF0331/DUF86 family)
MSKMIGFRNTVVHEYVKVDIGIVEAVIITELNELLSFADRIWEYVDDPDC